MFRFFSLTHRLAIFFTMVAAAMVLGLGMLFLVATERHFLELDRITLQDKQHLIENIVGRIQVQVQHLFSALNQPGSLAAASAAHRPPGEWSNPRSSWGAR